ncbi:hypothetical protein AALO_G00047130 [Alosa alosa]|uniref:Uncharacterized protein n=1 Tax=Alosa alosa TaxID=278164 RepID=A0AAV6H6E7_9TELE|nr:uncharacterized protein LOC125293522 [Alosa alosa]KAG5281642.1 hypothetical protein AALO_G00047130 [Alosa alosa]
MRISNGFLQIFGPLLSAAEKQWRYRARRHADENRRQEYLIKERIKWQKDKETGKKTGQKDRSSKAQRAQRKKWREAHERSKASQRLNSSPVSPDSTVSSPSGTSRQGELGRKVRRANKKKLTNDLAKLENKLKKAEQRVDKYKKRLKRLADANPSPRSKENKLVRNLSAENLRRTLLFHTVVADEVHNKYSQSKSQRDRQVISRIVTSKILKRYKLQKVAQEAFGFSRKRWRNLSRENVCRYERKRPRGVGVIIRSAVRSFFERDDVSRITTGKKQTVTRAKKKMQKRLLEDTMKNLHLKFLADHTQLCLSYSLFCSLRPYWVVRPTLADRETCMCKQHENLGFMAKKLHQLHVIDTSDIESLTERMACDTTRK